MANKNGNTHINIVSLGNIRILLDFIYGLLVPFRMKNCISAGKCHTPVNHSQTDDCPLL